MPRPKKCRKICILPENRDFGPLGESTHDTVYMTVDEYETIRLIDLEGFTQEVCAGQMKVARTTVQWIYNEARRKLADALVNGKCLHIEGGDYQLCDGSGKNCGRSGKCCCRKKILQEKQEDK